mmetsp:Transcript_44834/g.100721  ORF Transcript_44834/g.100721 Transcript_44834/m.100721 type:complete len:454 (-) Transcript_44834:687-2048(-)
MPFSGRCQALKLHVAELLFGGPEDGFPVLKQDHLVKGLSWGDHRQADVGHNLEVHKHRTVVRQPLLHDTGQLLLGGAGHRLDAVRLREHDKVRIHVVHADVAPIEEEALPDPHHLLPGIVHHGDLDRQVVPLHGLQVHVCHVEGPVTIEKDGHGVRVAHLRSDGERETSTHHAQAAARDHAAGPRPAHKLGGHHLVVAHTRTVEYLLLVHPPLLVDEVVRGLDDLLRLDFATGGFDIAECVVLLPLLALLDPLSTVSAFRRVDAPLHGLECMRGVGPDGDSRRQHLAEAALVDVDMDDAAGALRLRGLGLWRILRHDAGGAVIEAAAYGDDAVGVLDGKVGVGSPVHAEHVEGERVTLVEDAHAVDGGCHRDLGLVSDARQDLGAVAGALANVQDGALGAVDEVDRLLDDCHVHHRRGINRTQGGLPEDRSWHLSLRGHYVLGQVYVARTGPA